MYSTGHYGVSLTLFSPILGCLLLFEMPVLALIGLGIVLYTAPLPDIDIKPPFRYFLTHRTWTHSLWFALLVGVLSGSAISILTPALVYGLVELFAFGFVMGVFGVFGHLVGDVITPSGIRPLYPFGPKYSFHVTTAKGLWWFESTKSGNQHELTFWESLRHSVLNSNRIFLIIGLATCSVASAIHIVKL